MYIYIYIYLYIYCVCVCVCEITHEVISRKHFKQETGNRGLVVSCVICLVTDHPECHGCKVC